MAPENYYNKIDDGALRLPQETKHSKKSTLIEVNADKAIYIPTHINDTTREL